MFGMKGMDVKTHRGANQKLLGTPISITDDENAVVELEAIDEMAVDERGLIHGGFTFGLADYAAMLAVNHPNVVLGSAQVRFLAPVRVGEVLRAKAEVAKKEGRRKEVHVEVSVGGRDVFEGTMTCFVLERHVLER